MKLNKTKMEHTHLHKLLIQDKLLVPQVICRWPAIIYNFLKSKNISLKALVSIFKINMYTGKIKLHVCIK